MIGSVIIYDTLFQSCELEVKVGLQFYFNFLTLDSFLVRCICIPKTWHFIFDWSDHISINYLPWLKQLGFIEKVFL